MLRLALLATLSWALLPGAGLARADEVETATPQSQHLRTRELIQLTRWIRDDPTPVFSILVSRDGKLVYELYTSGLDREAAHYQMSVTKSVLSALIGAAIDRKKISGPDASIVELLPRPLFASDAERERLRPLTLAKVMGMSALDAPDPPRVRTPEALARYQRFWTAPSRVADALTRPLLDGGFQYNDANPALAVGALEAETGTGALEFAQEALFGPMGFRNAEWMHQDPSGTDNGGYGLRLRPVDMQKLGILYLDHGAWRGKQLLSRAWVERSFTPWNRSGPNAAAPDYGWFWWAHDYGPGWSAHLAKGWKGQRIAIFPEQRLVVTMTACIEDGSEDAFFNAIVEKILKPALEHGAEPTSAAESEELAALLAEVRRGRPRFSDWIEYRMVPSVEPKMPRRPRAPTAPTTPSKESPAPPDPRRSPAH